MSQAGLYVVATPIGNLEDMSYRAVRILSEADLIAAEDTRHSLPLLSHYGISSKLQALHEHNEDQVTGGILERIENGESVALISDFRPWVPTCSSRPGGGFTGIFNTRSQCDNGSNVGSWLTI